MAAAHPMAVSYPCVVIFSTADLEPHHDEFVESRINRSVGTMEWNGQPKMARFDSLVTNSSGTAYTCSGGAGRASRSATWAG